MAIKPAVVTKEDFVQKTGAKTLTLPKSPRVKKLSEEQATTFKAMLFGRTGSGKTYAIKGLLEHGFTVCVISTDMGGDGLVTVKTALRREGKTHLLDRCTSIVLTTFKEVEAFLASPEDFYPDIYTDGVEWLVWDGFSSFQQTLLSDAIGQQTPERAGGKEISDARESGLQLELQDWGQIKAGTVRNLDKFLKLYNRKTGEVFHKLVTCLEGMKSIRSGSGINTVTTYTDTREPMIQGAAVKLMGPAFDIILNTRSVTSKEEDTPTFKYYTDKTRGLALDPVEPGDFYALWEKIATQLNIVKGQKIIEEIPSNSLDFSTNVV